VVNREGTDVAPRAQVESRNMECVREESDCAMYEEMRGRKGMSRSGTVVVKAINK